MVDDWSANQRAFGILLGFIAGAIFGTASIAIRYVSLDALTIIYWRLMMGGLIIILFWELRGKPSVFSKKVFVSSFLLFMHFYLFVKAVQDTTILNATILTDSAPIITLTISYLALGEKPAIRDILAVLIGFIGIVLVSGGSIYALNYGNLEALGAALMISLYGVSSRKFYASDREYYKYSGEIFFLSGLYALAVSLAMSNIVVPNKLDFILLLYLAVFPTGIGHTLYLASIKHIDPHETQILALLEPITATILAMIILKEIPNVISIIGGSLIALSIVIISQKKEVLDNVA